MLLLILTLIVPAGAESRSKHSWKRLQGTLDVVYVDSFNRFEHQVVSLIAHRNTKPWLIKFIGARPQLRSGDAVQLRGRKLRNNAVIVRAKRDLHYQRSAAASTALVGSRRLAIIRIQALDGAPSCSAALLADRFWTGTRSINGLYQASSFGQLSFPSDSNNDGQPEVLQVNINENTLGRCNQYGAIASSADSALAARGITLTSYQHRVYILPTNVRYGQLDTNGNPIPSSELAACYWAGMASVGGTHSWIPGEWCGVTEDSTDVITHEVGHNLGFVHAHTDLNQDGITDAPDGEYGDLSCPMGRANRNYRHFNIVHKLQLGWTSAYANVTSSGAYSLSAEDGAVATPSAPHALLLSTRLGTMFLSYRAALDSYSSHWQSAYYGRTNIHWGALTPGASNFIIALGDGQSYRDPDTGTVISQISHNAGSAQVSISFGGLAPAAPSMFSVN